MPKNSLSALVKAKEKKSQQASKPARQEASKPELKKKTFRLEKSIAIQLAVLAAKQEKSEQDLVTEALELLFKKHAQD